MEKYVCLLCGYVYDPETGDPDNDIAPNTPFSELPEDWRCPICNAGKSQFVKQSQTFRVNCRKDTKYGNQSVLQTIEKQKEEV